MEIMGLGHKLWYADLGKAYQYLWQMLLPIPPDCTNTRHTCSCMVKYDGDGNDDGGGEGGDDDGKWDRDFDRTSRSYL